jgi:hypothetical protein
MTKRGLLLRGGMCLSLACCLSTAAAEPKTFEERRHLAQALEDNSKTAQRYLYSDMYPAIGSAMADAMLNCLKPSGVSSEPFSLIADVSRDGRFMQIAYEPQSNTAACFATAVSSFRVPSPPPFGQESFPIVMDMKIKP